MFTYEYLFSPSGKLNRLSFLGMLVVSLVASMVAIFITALVSKITGLQNLLFVPLMLAIIYVSYCIYMKRFNDIGKMHKLLQIHFSASVFIFLLIMLQAVNAVTVILMSANGLLGLVVFCIAVFAAGTTPIKLVYQGKEITLELSVLTRVKKDFVPNFDTTGMLVFIAGGEEVIMTKQEYEKRQHILEYADRLYVFHLADLK